MSLPLSRSEQSPERAEQKRERLERILLIEDTPEDALIIRELLASAGRTPPTHAVTHAWSMAEALESLRHDRYDTILLDLMLPDSERLDSVLRVHLAAPSVPLVVLTANEDAALASDALQHGAQDYLVKGAFDRDLLLRAIRYARERQAVLARLNRYVRDLETSEHKFRMVVTSTADGIVILDLGHVVRFSNPAAEGILGVAPGGLDGKPLSIQVGDDGQSEIELRGPGGETLVIEAHPTAIEWEGAPARVISLRDITERKRREVFERRAAELARSNAELQQFAYLASHDLQEPLRTVTLFAQLLAKRSHDQLDEHGRRALGFIEEGASRMRAQIQALLDYSRVDGPSPELRPIDLEAVLAAGLSSLSAALETSGARVTHDPLPTVVADSDQMRQVLENLIHNAIKFHGAAPPLVHVSAERTPGEWIFSVKDNGIGIEPKYHERIFQIFQRLHQRDEYPGTGIGLAIVKRIVERQGGRIWVESSLGAGSTFRFTVPT